MWLLAFSWGFIVEVMFIKARFKPVVRGVTSNRAGQLPWVCVRVRVRVRACVCSVLQFAVYAFVRDGHVRIYVHIYTYHVNRSLIQSLTLMRSAIIPRYHNTLTVYHSPHAGVPPVFFNVPSPPASLVFEGSNLTYKCTAKAWLHEYIYIYIPQSVL